ncbi:hypothetical protein D3C71_1959680 [compost metagenome]
MCGGVAVAADNRFTGMGQADFRSHNVYDTLVDIIQVKQSDSEIAAVLRQCVNLLLGDRVRNIESVLSWNIVVHGCKGQLRTADLAAA